MKNRKLQRVLTWILTLTMILGTFDGTGFATRAAEPDDEAEVVVDDADDPDESKSDISVNLDLKSAYATGKIQYAKVNAGDDIVAIPATGANAASTANTRATVDTDSENDYQVYLAVDEGYVFDSTAVESVKYKDYTGVNYATPYTALGEEKTAEATEYTVEQVSDALLLVTIPSALLKKVIAASYFKDYDATTAANKVAAPVITVLAKANNGLKKRVLDKPSVVNAQSLDDIQPTDRTAQWIPTSNATDAFPYNLSGFITDKTLTANMIKVTYTESGKDPVTVTATGAEINNTAGSSANYVQFTSSTSGSTTTSTLKIARAWINNFVYNKADIAIAIDGSANDTNKKTITAVSDSAFATLVKHDSTTPIDGSEFTITSSDPIDVDVKMNGGNGTREVKNIVVTENNDGTKWTLFPNTDSIFTATTANKCYKIAAYGRIDDDITIAVTTNEVVTFNGHESAGIFDVKGNPLTVAESGKALTFEVRPDTGKELTKLVYSVGNASDNVELTKTSDNFYTIPEGVIVDQLFIEATTATTADQRQVTPVLVASSNLNDDDLAMVYVGEVSGSYVDTETDSNNDGLTGEEFAWDGTASVWKPGYAAAVAGKYFYFTVEPEDPSYTTFAQYRFATTGAWVDAEFVKTTSFTTKNQGDPAVTHNAYVYRTEVIPGTVLQLKAWGVSGAVLHTPDNDRVTVDYVDNQIVDINEDFYFTVTSKESANSTIKVDRVQWTTGATPSDTTTNVLAEVGGKYCIDKSNFEAGSGVMNSIKVFVYTTETMNADAYTATFTLAKEDDKTENPYLVNTKDASGKITDQKLNLVYGSDTGSGNVLKVNFKTTERVPDDKGEADYTKFNVNEGVEGFRVASYSTDSTDKTKNIVTLASGIVVTGSKVGNDTIIATHVTGTTYNKVLWTASLDVEVTAAFTDLTLYAYDTNDNEVSAIMVDPDGQDATFSNKTAQFVVKGTDVRTGKVVEVTSSASAGAPVRIDWSFDPDNKAMDQSSMNYKFATNSSTKFASLTTNYTNATTSSVAFLYNASNAFVRAKAADPATIKVIATCTVAGEEKPLVLEKEISLVDEAHFAAFVTTQVSGAAEESFGWTGPDTTPSEDATTTEVTVVGDQDLELVANGLNSLSVQYDVYKRVSAPTEAQSKEQLNAKVEAGAYAQVGAADGITWEAVVENWISTDKAEYIAVSGGENGKYTVTAKAKTPEDQPSEVTIRAYKNGVVVAENSFYVTVVNTFAKDTVTLLLDDPGTYTVTSDNKSKPVQQALTSAAYTAKASSIIEPNTVVSYASLVQDGNKQGYGIKSVRGIDFIEETDGASFILPTQADFDQSKIGTNQILVGWATVSSSALSGTENGLYFYPGEEVTVIDGTVYKAIWAPKYAFADSVSDYTSEKYGMGTAVFNQNLETKDAEGKITGYSKAFASINPYTYTAPGASSSEPAAAGEIAQGGEIPLVLKMVERSPFTAELKGKLSSSSFAALTTATKYVYTNDLTIEASGANASMLSSDKGTLKASATAGLVTGQLNITVKWAEGNKTYSTDELPMTIVANKQYTLSINGGQDKTLVADQSNNNVVDVVLKEGDNKVHSDDYGNYTFTWTSSDESVAKVETVVLGAGDADKIMQGKITPLKEGTTTLTLEAVDAFGTKAVTTDATDCLVTVTANDVVFTVKDADGNAIDLSKGEPIMALANDTANTGYTISADPAITIQSIEGDDTIVNDTIDMDLSTTGTQNGNSIDASTRKLTLTTNNVELSDKGWILIHYTKSGDHSGTTYAKKINVETYYIFKLKSNNANKVFITKDGEQIKNNNTAVDADVRVTLANQVKLNDGTYRYTNFDLTGYAAVDTDGVDGGPVDFIGWDKATGAAGALEVDFLPDATITAKITYDGTFDGAVASHALNAGTVVLVPDFAAKSITGVTIAQSTATLSNEDAEANRGGLANDKVFTLNVEPYDTKASLTLVPDKAKLYGNAAGLAGAVNAKTSAGASIGLLNGKITLAYASVATKDDTNKKRTDAFYIKTIAGRAGVVKFDVKSPSGVVLETITVNINGYDAVDDAYYEAGVKVVNDSRKVGGVTWFFDEEGKHVTGDKIITKADGTRIAIVNGELAGTGKVHIGGKDYVVGQNGVLITGWITATFTAASGAADGVYYADPDADGALLSSVLKKIGDKTYYFKANQEKAVASANADLFELQGEYYVNAVGEVAINGIFRVKGVNRLFREDGSIVSYTDPDVISGKIKIGGVDYVIDPKDDSAKRDDVLYNAKVNWTVKFPNSFTKGTAAPELQYEVTYTSANTNETKTSDPIKVTATSTNNFSAGSTDKEVTFTAVADLTGYFEDKEGTKPAKNVELTKTYKFKEGSDESTGGGSESGSSESEPESNFAYNLFYDCDIVIPIPDGADPSKGTGKWTSFYKVESDGKVTVTGDRKKAASAANSLITMPVFDGETQVGEYSYQLPVSYVKPKLKLSATKATIKKGEEQTVSTVVLEKKSNGMFEPIDVSAQKEGVAYYTATKGAATVEEGDNAGELFITASDATKGKIKIQLDNWTDFVELAFSVSAVAKDVLTVSAKSKVMNVAGGDDAAVTILLNNKEIESDSNVTVTMPKGFDQSGIEVEGIEEGKVTSSELKFTYKDGATVKKGNYTFKFACGKAKANFKLTVSDAALAEKAVSLKVKTKLDLVSGQKMVIEPTLKGINGEISDIALDAANAELFDIEYNDELNQIYISAKDITKVNSTTKYTFVITLTVGGKECTATLKNQKLQAKNPAVKIAKLTLPKAQASTADAAVNVSATYKLGGKTFSVAPAAVKFTNGTAVEGEEGWFIDSKTNAKVFYNAEEGVIEVKAGATAIKSGSIAVEVSFAGSTKAVKKSLSIKVK